MTIQLSVSIWTVICFVLLMLILHNLLFKPVLKVMDDRRARIQNAAAKRTEYERLESKQAAARQEKEAAIASAQQKQIKAEIEAIRADSRKAVETARTRRLRQTEDYRADSETELAAILAVLSAHKAELAAVFADSVTKE